MTVVGTAEILIAPVSTGFEKELKDQLKGPYAAAARDAESGGAQIGGGLRKGVKGETGRLAADLEKDGAKAGEGLHRGLSGGLEKVAGLLGQTGLPLESFRGGLERSAGAAEHMGAKSSGLAGALDRLGGVALAGVGATMVGVAAGALDVGEKMQGAEASIAAASGTSVKAAASIGSAFEGTAFRSEFSAIEMAKAFASVAGQLKETEGHALSAGQASQFMAAADDLATAKQIDLGTAVKATAGVMQAFGLKTSDAAHVSDVLYKTSVATGQSVDTLASQIERLHGRLGDASGSLGDLTGLMVDMTDRGITGRAALGAVNTAMNTLISSGTGVQKALQLQNGVLAQMPANLRKLAEEYQHGEISSKDFTKATQGLPADQAQLVSSFTTASKAVETANEKYKALGVQVFDARGKFVGMRDIIEQLHGRLAGMSEQQQLATASMLFGSGAARQMLAVIQAGPAAYDRATASVNQHGSAQRAAATQASSLHVEMKTLEAGAVDLAGKIGTVLIPIVTTMIADFTKATTFVLDHKGVLIALAGVVTGILGPAIAVFAINKMASFVNSFKDASGHVKQFATDVEGVVTRVTSAFSKQNASAGTMASTVKTKTAEASTAAAGEATEVEASGTAIEGSNTRAGASFTAAAGEATAAGTAVEGDVAAEATAVTAADTTIEGENVAAGASFATVLGGLAALGAGVGIPFATAAALRALQDQVVGKGASPRAASNFAVTGVQGVAVNAQGQPYVPGASGAGGNTSLGGTPASSLPAGTLSTVYQQLGIKPPSGSAVVSAPNSKPQGSRTHGAGDLRAHVAGISTKVHRARDIMARAASGNLPGLDAAQSAIAEQIIAEGQRLGAPPAAIQAALDSAFGESSFNPAAVNPTSGDSGVFQSSTHEPTAAQIQGWYTGGASFQGGGGIAQIKSGHSTGQTATNVEASGEPGSYYGKYDAQSAAIMRAAGTVAPGAIPPAGTATPGAAPAAPQLTLAQRIAQETGSVNAEVSALHASLRPTTRTTLSPTGRFHTTTVPPGADERTKVAGEIAALKAALQIEISQQKGELSKQTAQQKAELSKQGTDLKSGSAELNKLVSAVHSGKLSELKTALVQAHNAKLGELEKELSHDHNVHLADLAKQLEHIHAQAMADFVKKSTAAAASSATSTAAATPPPAPADMTSAVVTAIGDQAQLTADTISGASAETLAVDQAQLQLDQDTAAGATPYQLDQDQIALANAKAAQTVANATTQAKQAAAASANPTPAATPGPAAPATYVFNITDPGTAGGLMREINWQLTIGGLPVAQPAAA